MTVKCVDRACRQSLYLPGFFFLLGGNCVGKWLGQRTGNSHWAMLFAFCGGKAATGPRGQCDLTLSFRPEWLRGLLMTDLIGIQTIGEGCIQHLSPSSVTNNSWGFMSLCNRCIYHLHTRSFPSGSHCMAGHTLRCAWQWFCSTCVSDWYTGMSQTAKMHATYCPDATMLLSATDAATV